MKTGQGATVITFPTRHNQPDGDDIGGALVELDTTLRTTVERMRDLSIQLDRSLQYGNLHHTDDPIAFTAHLHDLIDNATRTTVTSRNHIQTATELWNRENNQQ